MVPSLPFEIWSRIASFLPAESVKKLYGVNRAMFELAMEEKYHAAFFESPDDVLHALPLLKNPIASSHVRTLELSPHIIHGTLMRMRKNEGSDTLIAKAFRTRKRKRVSTESVTPLEQITLILDGMANLGSLKLHCHGYQHCRDLRLSMACITPALTSFKGLRVLTLDIMVEGYQYLSPTAVFPLLETLYIALSNAYCSTDSRALLDNILVPFVNNHRSSLRVFNLSSIRSPYTFDIPAFLLKLRHFPRLKNFSLWQPFVSIRQSNSAGVSHVLRLHSEHLLELSLHVKGPIQYSMYPTAEQWYAQEFLEVKLPKLQVLDLDIELYPDIIQTAAFLGRFRDSLLSLKLSVNTLSYDDVEHIAKTFSTRDQLRELSMSVGVLSPQLFTLLAENLPSLNMLNLEFNELLGSITSDSGAEEGVWWDSSVNTVYDTWKLNHLTLEPSNAAFRDFDRCEVAIQAALPRLQTLDVGRKTFDRGR